eukprot:3365716-Pyramimonas_sp.AAC.1
MPTLSPTPFSARAASRNAWTHAGPMIASGVWCCAEPARCRKRSFCASSAWALPAVKDAFTNSAS